MMRGLEFFAALLTVSVGFGQQESAFFRIVSPANSEITGLQADGTLAWANAETAGVTCMVQRATTLTGPSNWVDYVQHAATNASVALRVFDPAPPLGMALIPAGSFQMGDSINGYNKYEKPTHTVYVSAFYLGKTEVTWAEWQVVRDWSTANGYGYDNVGSGKADNHPVHTVNWHDAVKWCNARSQKEGRPVCYYTDAALTQVYKAGQVAPYVKWTAAGYRLPTEAEWEKAARGGLSNKRFPWGDMITHSKANYYSTGDAAYFYDISPTQGYHPVYGKDPYPYTNPVGTFDANGYGLHDMAGNIVEWCWDRYDGYYYATSPSRNPHGPETGSFRVLRGGSWFQQDATYSRVVSRSTSYNPTYNGGVNNKYLGFRVVLSTGQQ